MSLQLRSIVGPPRSTGGGRVREREMNFVVRRDLRVETIDGAAIILDRSGKVVHHISGEGAEALNLVTQGIDEKSVPDHLATTMALLVDAGLVETPDLSRRKLLRLAGAGLTGAALVTVALASPAAARSGTGTVDLVKSLNGNNDPDPPLPTLCTIGGVGNSGRGTSVFTRSEGPARIRVTVTLSTGTSAVGRDVYILQSKTSPSSCVGGTGARVGVWAASPALGPQTFTAPIVTGANRFVVALQLSGGGGVDGWSSYPVVLP